MEIKVIGAGCKECDTLYANTLEAAKELKVSVTVEKVEDLMEIVKLIGSDVLPDDQKLTLEIARVIRLGFLQHNAFHPDDTCVSLEKQFKMMEVILYLYKKCKDLVAQGKPMSQVVASGIFDKVTKMKYDVPNDHIELLDDYFRQIDAAVSQVA